LPWPPLCSVGRDFRPLPGYYLRFRSGLSSGTYFAGKLIHAVISALYSFLLCSVFSFGQPVSVYLVERISEVASLDFRRSLYISVILSSAIALLLICALILLIIKKYWKNMRDTI
jgi:hypothetical protein